MSTKNPTDSSSESLATADESVASLAEHTHEANLEVFRCLSKGSGNRPRLPAELVLQILALPSRWILHSSFSLAAGSSVSSDEGERMVVSTPSLQTEDIFLTRKVVVTFTSKDQGWSSYRKDQGTFRNSWTWFQIGLARNNQKKLVADESTGEMCERVYWKQPNKHAWPEWESYCIVLELGHRIFEDLEEGDALVLWAVRAFPFFSAELFIPIKGCVI